MRTEAFETTTALDSGAAVAWRNGTAVPGSRQDWAEGLAELALAPERLLFTAVAAPDLHLDRTADPERPGVAFTWSDARVSVELDRRSGFPVLVRLERAYPELPFWAMWGTIRLETRWSGWSEESNGIWYPRRRATTLNGEPFRDAVVTRLELDGPVPPDTLAAPDSVRTAFRAALSAPPAPIRLDPVPLADGVVLYRGGYQAAAVRQPDGVIVLEAPQSDAKSRAVLADVTARFPGARVKAVITTSPMWFHLAGLHEYAARGIPIYGLERHQARIRRLLSSRRSAQTERAARVIPVRNRTVIGTGASRLVLQPGLGPKGGAMMLVHLPDRRLLYASDLVVPATFEPVFDRGYRTELARTIDRLGLAVDTVFTLHLPPEPAPR
jgi:hypothetical protein